MDLGNCLRAETILPFSGKPPLGRYGNHEVMLPLHTVRLRYGLTIFPRMLRASFWPTDSEACSFPRECTRRPRPTNSLGQHIRKLVGRKHSIEDAIVTEENSPNLKWTVAARYRQLSVPKISSFRDITVSIIVCHIQYQKAVISYST